MLKICRDCRLEKPLDDFPNLKKSKDGKHYRCKVWVRHRKMKAKEGDKLYDDYRIRSFL